MNDPIEAQKKPDQPANPPQPVPARQPWTPPSDPREAPFHEQPDTERKAPGIQPPEPWPRPGKTSEP